MAGLRSGSDGSQSTVWRADLPAIPDLFPELGGTTIDLLGLRPYRITLPDGTAYGFYYNSYGEVARIALPTGGGIDFDFGAGLDSAVEGVYASGQVLSSPLSVISTSSTPPWQPYIYRRLITRREYPVLPPEGTPTEGLAAYASSIQTFDSAEQVAGPMYFPGTTRVLGFTTEIEGPVTVTTTGAGGVTATREHTFGSGGIAYPGQPLHFTLHPGPLSAGIQAGRRAAVLAIPSSLDGVEVRDREVGGLETIEKVYYAGSDYVPYLCQERITRGGNTSQRVYQYDEFSNIVDLYEYDYGAGPGIGTVVEGPHTYWICPASTNGFTRHTHTEYKRPGTPEDTLYFTDPVFLPSLEVSKVVYDATGKVSQTDTTYDSTALTAGSATQHDPAYGTGFTKRGNVTEVHRWLKWEGANETVKVSSAWYDTSGNPVQITNAENKTTRYTYDMCAGSLPSRITNALNQETELVWDCGGGKVISIEDPNGVVTTAEYDAMDRLKTVSRAGLVRTQYQYPEPTRVVMLQDKETFGDGLIRTETIFDGLGRAVEARMYGDGCSPYSLTETRYDALGRVWKVSNPRCVGEAEQWTTTVYDALGRVRSVSYPDNSVATAEYVGAVTIATDPAGKQRRTTTDAFGRIVQVVEVGQGSDPSYTTAYTYNALDNLTGVQQSGQTRTFGYDSWGLLRRAINPESGTTTYEYDKNGNLTRRTDQRGIVTTMTYEALNRVVSKTYSDGTPSVTYIYDQDQSIVDHAETNYPVGRLVKVSNGVSETKYRYDALGRVTASEQKAGESEAYRFGYTYQPAGLRAMTYPQRPGTQEPRRVVTYSYDAAGRVMGVNGQLGTESLTYVSSAGYTPHGALSSMVLGTGKTEQWCYNQRQQAVGIRVGSGVSGSCAVQSGDLLHLALSYGANGVNNGNVMSQTVTVPGQGGFTQTYTYDSQNRLKSVTETAVPPAVGNWSAGYDYDAFGNIWLTSPTYPTDLGTPVNGAQYSAATNRLVKFPDGQPLPDDTYDEAGNLQKEPWLTVSSELEYDAENRLVSHTRGGVRVEYSYDGEGRRVRRVGPDGTTVYVYDAMGRLAAEYGSSEVLPCGETPCYVTADHLGSTRLVAGVTGLKRYDYRPFGEELYAGDGGRTVEMGYTAARDRFSRKFTGKERDAETGLDYFEARYFSSAQGRFTSPDPYNIITEAEDRKHFDTYISQPQNWNRYAYVWNNPLRYVDPHGETVYVVGYTSGNPDGGDDEFKKAALTLANQIMSKKGFDPRKDIVLVQAVSTKDDFKALLKDANSLESRFGKIGSLSLFSHGGPLDGPRFARNSPGATEKDWQFYGGESELRGLKINWEQGAQANFFGCNTAVSFAQRFANAQGTPTWGFNTSSSFSGDPNGKSKMYMLQPWNPNLYMTGRDGRSMVKRDPQQPKR